MGKVEWWHSFPTVRDRLFCIEMKNELRTRDEFYHDVFFIDICPECFACTKNDNYCVHRNTDVVVLHTLIFV